MKMTLILALLITSKVAEADDLKFTIGSMATQHLKLSSEMRKLLKTKSGFVLNNLRVEAKLNQHNIIVSEDCMAQPLYGYYKEIYKLNTENFESNLVLGAYITPMAKWTIPLPITYNVKNLGIKIWPIAGIKIEKSLYKTKKQDLKFNSLVGPDIIVLGLGVEF